jgi:hypothetical protein
MGNKNTAKREVKKKPQPKIKTAPGRKREDFIQAPARIVREATEKD